MSTLSHLTSVCVVLSLIAVSVGEEKTEAAKYGWKVGELMPFHVADFAYGHKNGHCGCPSIMVKNANGRGIMIWTKSGSPQAYELAAALDGKLGDDRKVQGFLLNFSGDSLETLRQGREKYPLQRFIVARPRDSVQFMPAKVVGDAETVIFFVEQKEIKQILTAQSGEMTDERIREIAAAVDEFVAPTK